jgi:hypothetical protein
MNLLHAGVDTTVIALWLGHADVRSTNAYLHAEFAIRTRPRPRHPDHASAGRYRPPDQLLTFLGTLWICRPFKAHHREKSIHTRDFRDCGADASA